MVKEGKVESINGNDINIKADSICVHGCLLYTSDPQGRDEILDQIERLNRRYGLTILLVSHSMEDVARYVDRIMVMNHGEKVFDDTPKEVFKHYKELEDMGLAAPQITYVVQELREHGIPVDDTITTVEEARDAILKDVYKRQSLHSQTSYIPET